MNGRGVRETNQKNAKKIKNKRIARKGGREKVKTIYLEDDNNKNATRDIGKTTLSDGSLTHDGDEQNLASFNTGVGILRE